MSAETSKDNTKKGISIILNVHNQASELRRNLPALLSLTYNPGYEVIVVDESSTDETDDVLKQFKVDNRHLYTTYIPASSHYLSRQKLAITVGIKAAHNEWIILTQADCHPDSDEWLTLMADAMTDETDVVCGFTGFEKTAKTRYEFLRIVTFSRQLSHPFRYDGANIAIRKSVFMQRNGFLKNLQLLRGEYDFLVNETRKNRIAFVKQPEATMRQEAPSRKAWVTASLYYMQTRRYLRGTFMSRVLFMFHQTLLHAATLLSIAAVIAVLYLHYPIAYVGGSIAAFFLILFLRVLLSYRLVKSLGEAIPVYKFLYLDLTVAWHYAYYMLRYLFANKSDFMRK